MFCSPSCSVFLSEGIWKRLHRFPGQSSPGFWTILFFFQLFIFEHNVLRWRSRNMKLAVVKWVIQWRYIPGAPCLGGSGVTPSRWSLSASPSQPPAFFLSSSGVFSEVQLILLFVWGAHGLQGSGSPSTCVTHAGPRPSRELHDLRSCPHFKAQSPLSCKDVFQGRQRTCFSHL